MLEEVDGLSVIMIQVKRIRSKGVAQDERRLLKRAVVGSNRYNGLRWIVLLRANMSHKEQNGRASKANKCHKVLFHKKIRSKVRRILESRRKEFGCECCGGLAAIVEWWCSFKDYRRSPAERYLPVPAPST